MTKSDAQNKKKGEKNQPLAPTYLSSIYLEYVKLTNFGKFANMIVGPFKPGLNVVYGANEAGKTTISELIKNVMFGWRASRRGSNSYKPENSERIGSLFFKDDRTGDVEEIKRTKNSEGVVDRLHVLDDIDKETYETMFALNSDELLKLDRHNEVTARLLTAGSGTASSPAIVLAKIQEEIRALMSRSAQTPDSIALLREEQEREKTLVQELLNETDSFYEEEHRLESLLARKEALTEAQAGLNTEIEELKSNYARLEGIDASIEQNTALLEETRASEQQMRFSDSVEVDENVRALSKLSSAEEYEVKTLLDDLDEERLKYEHALDSAKREVAKSTTAFETLINDHDFQTEQDRAKKQRRIRLIIAFVILVCMGIVGIWLFRQGRAVGSLTYSAFGVITCLCGLLVAAGGIVANMHPSKTEEAFEERRRDYEWVKYQDEQHLEFCERDLADHKNRAKWFLDQRGFSAAEGSIRQARHLLDLAHDMRTNEETTKQNLQALSLQRASLESLLGTLAEQRRELCLSMGLDPEAQLADLEAIIERKNTERAKTSELIQETNLQFGQISSELSHARHATTFDEAKQRKAIVDARLKERYHELAVLLLAQRSLEISIAEWERKSQPEVYKQASRLFAQMTKGAWQKVRMNAEGEIEALDSVKTACPPQLLSLGTRQQLYLALRVALLITAENVGRSLPILCDDILVNFDDERRREAIKVIVELSRYRQVILFTCHPSVAALVRECDCSCNFFEL